MLSGSALRQFAWIVIKTSGADPTGLVDQVNKRDRYAATRELEAAGLVLVHRERGKASRYEVRTLHNISNIKYISYISGSDIEATSRGKPHPSGKRNTLPVEENLYTRITSPVEENLYGYDSLEDEADDIDSMPQDGRDTPQRAHTPFRARRERQRNFVQRVWVRSIPTCHH